MPHDLVTVAVFADSVSAQAARGHLVAHGLRAFVLDEHASALMPHFDMALGVRLQVPRAESERALALLSEVQSGAHILDETEIEAEIEAEAEAAGDAAPEAAPRADAAYRSGEMPAIRIVLIGAVVAGVVAALLLLAGH
jgi:hypothetical protein